MGSFAVVGHVAIDKIMTSAGSRTQVGGPPAYVASVCQKLGAGLQVVTKVGEDIPRGLVGDLSRLGIEAKEYMVEDGPTTRFVLDYRGGERRLSVEGRCDDIGPGDVLDIRDEVVLAPIVGEVPGDTLSAMSSSVVALDPQGFLRDIGPGGLVSPRAWYDEELLKRVSVFKASASEMGLITGGMDTLEGLRKIVSLGAEAAVATRGELGSMLVVPGKAYLVPVYGVRKTLDPTGAGDAFLAGFFSEYLKGEDILWCTSMGSAAASTVVETLGPRVVASLRDLRGRAGEVHEGVARLG